MAHSSEISAKSLRARQVRQIAGQILAQIFLASKVQQLYAPDNENVRRSFDALVQKLNEFFESERVFRMHLEEGYLFVNETRLRLERATSDAHYWFLERFAASGLASIIIDPGVSAVELRKLVPIIARAVWAEDAPRPAIEAELQAAFVNNARVTMRRSREMDQDEASHVELSSARLAAQLWLRLRRAALDACTTAREGGQLSVRKARSLLQLVVDAYLEDEPPLLATTRVKLFEPGAGLHRSPDGSGAIRPQDIASSKSAITGGARWESYLATHMANTSVLAIGLGHRLGLERRRLLDLGTAALYADSSMARVPKEIVESEDELSEFERAEVEAHGLRSAEMLLVADGGAPANFSAAAAVARHTSAQRKRPGERRRPLDAAIVGLVDAYDALTTDRPWRASLGHAEALRRLLGESEGLEQALTRVFANLIGMFPVGSAVELTDGRVAVVLSQNPDIRAASRPLVKVLIEKDGRAAEGLRLDLSVPEPSTGRMLAIKGMMDLGIGESGPVDLVAAF